MTGPEHYREAERLRECARDFMGNLEKAAYFNAAAQVHATLALAAAVGVGMPVYIDGEQAMPPRDSAAWGDVAATRSRPIQTVNLPEPQGR